MNHSAGSLASLGRCARIGDVIIAGELVNVFSKTIAAATRTTRAAEVVAANARWVKTNRFANLIAQRDATYAVGGLRASGLIVGRVNSAAFEEGNRTPGSSIADIIPIWGTLEKADAMDAACSGQ